MALTEVQAAQVEKLFATFGGRRVPPSARSKVRIGYRIDGNAVILFEERSTFDPPHEWRETPVAKFIYVGSKRQWRLYCQHRDLRWHSYERLPAASSVAELLNEVDQDPTGIFWG